jgi:hypothetical protein
LQARSNEANVASIPFNSLLDAADIEKEAHDMRDKLVTDLYLLDDPALLHPIINTIPALVKARMSLGHLLVAALASWTPENMKARQRPPMQIRAVEKTLRAAMGHIIKYVDKDVWLLTADNPRLLDFPGSCRLRSRTRSSEWSGRGLTTQRRGGHAVRAYSRALASMCSRMPRARAQAAAQPSGGASRCCLAAGTGGAA